MKRPKAVRVRRAWSLNPATRVSPSKKLYKRRARSRRRDPG